MKITTPILLVISAGSLLLSSCSGRDVIRDLLSKDKVLKHFVREDDPRPPHPGDESSRGEITEFTKDQYDDWQSTRKYSEEQKEQLKQHQQYSN